MLHYHFPLTSICNQDCLFCLVKDEPKVGHTYSQALAKLKRARASGARHLSIDGGEPGLVPYFPDLIRACVRMGFKKIAIKTNGYGFHEYAQARSILEGHEHILKLHVSLHAGTRVLHDALTRKGSFSIATAAMRNIVRLQGDVTANIVLCAKNFRALKRYVDTMDRLGVRKGIILFIVPHGNASRHPRLIPDITETVHFVQGAVDYANTKNIELALTFFPFCVLDPYYIPYAVEAHMPDRFKDKKEFFKDKHRAKQCARCAHYRQCPGVWEAYYRMKGFVFRPITVARERASSINV